MIELVKVVSYEEELSEEVIATNDEFDIMVGGVKVGFAHMIVQDDNNYLYTIDINEDSRNHGYGTEAIKSLSKMYGGIYFAPDNEDAQRLYERISDEVPGWDEFKQSADQGYGVYEL